MPDDSSGGQGQADRKQSRMGSLARYSEIGFIIPSSVLLGLLFGKLADHWLHTQWLYLVGLLFGAVVGFWQMIRMAMRAFSDETVNDKTVIDPAVNHNNDKK